MPQASPPQRVGGENPVLEFHQRVDIAAMGSAQAHLGRGFMGWIYRHGYQSGSDTYQFSLTSRVDAALDLPQADPSCRPTLGEGFFHPRQANPPKFPVGGRGPPLNLPIDRGD